MLTTDQHVDTVYQIIRESLALDKGLPFAGFRELIETVLGGRKPLQTACPGYSYPSSPARRWVGTSGRPNRWPPRWRSGGSPPGAWTSGRQDTDDALWRTLGATRTVNLATGLIPLSFLTLGRSLALGSKHRWS